MRRTGLVPALVLGLLAATVVTVDAAQPGWVADYRDDFDGPLLDAGWTIRDGYADQFPADTANHASFGLDDGRLTISFPAGAEHNQWWLRQAEVLRSYEGSGVYQIKVDSAFAGSQQFGLSFESSPGTFLQFMLYADGEIRGYVERFVLNGGVIDKATVDGFGTGLFVPRDGPYYIRVSVDDDPDRSNRSWVFDWSTDGANWVTGASGIYETGGTATDVGDLQTVGVFAGNQPPDLRAYSASIDYFYATDDYEPAPLDPPVVAATNQTNRVELTWNEVLVSDTYSVRRATSPGGPYALIARPSAATYADVNVTGATTYYYTVAVDRNGTEGPVSSPVLAVPIAPPTPPAAPLDGLVLALDAGNLTLSDGALVDLWPDASGGAVDASASGSARPTFVAAGIGGRASVRFDGVDDFLRLPEGFEDFTDGMSLYVVAEPTVLQSGFKLLALGNGQSLQNIVLGRSGDTDGVQYFATSTTNVGSSVDTAAAFVTGQASILSVDQGGGPVDTMVVADVARDGVPIGSGEVFVPQIQSRDLNYVGRSYWFEGWFEGEIAEVLLYDRALSSAERGEVLDYLAAKYQLSRPTDPDSPQGPGPGGGPPGCDPSSPPFADVDPSSFAFADIACIRDLGLTTGTGDNTFSPAGLVTREQMSAFLARLWRTQRVDCDETSMVFVDVEPSSFAYGDISCIYGLGITTGVGPTTFAPGGLVTREQMAAFVARTWRRLGGECDTSHPPFTDVDPDSFAHEDISCIYNLGITTGTGANTYSPADPVTREQMASFLARLWRRAVATGPSI